MLLPLPGSSGYRIEQRPISSPAAAIAGISTQDFMSYGWPCPRHDAVERQSHAEGQRRQRNRESRKQIRQLGIRPVQRCGLMGDR